MGAVNSHCSVVRHDINVDVIIWVLWIRGGLVLVHVGTEVVDNPYIQWVQHTHVEVASWSYQCSNSELRGIDTLNETFRTHERIKIVDLVHMQ
jgi:hypothetical protein